MQKTQNHRRFLSSTKFQPAPFSWPMPPMPKFNGLALPMTPTLSTLLRILSWNFIHKFLPDVKLIFTTPVIRTDKSNANENNKHFIHCLKKAKFDCIHHTNIIENHLSAYGLHINRCDTRILVKNLMLGGHAMWREKVP